MRTKIIWFLVMLLALGGAGWYLLGSGQVFTASPLSKRAELANISNAIADEQGNVYAILNSKKTVVKMDPEGVIDYRIDGAMQFNDLAVDAGGRLYALETELDEYGLYVLAERIVRFTPDGKTDRVVFRKEYDKNDKLMRIGNVRSLQSGPDGLYFFLLERGSIGLNRIEEAGTGYTTVFTAQLPPDRYLSEISGLQPGSIFYTSKRGGIFRIGESGESALVYPLEGVDRTRRNFPQSIVLDAADRIYYIDQYLNDISRIDLHSPYVVESLFSQSDYGEIESISVSGDGSVTAAWADRIVRLDQNGRRLSDLENAEYSAAAMATRIGIWLLALAEAALLVYACRYLYLHLLQRKVSLAVKLVVVFVPLIIGSMAVLSATVFISFSNKMKEEVLRELSFIAQNGRNLIDGNQLEQLDSPLDYMSDNYRAIKQKMGSIFTGDDAEDRKGLYSTLYKFENGKLYIITDDDDGVNMFKPFPMDEDNRMVAEQGVIATGEWQDTNGSWMYAMGPLYNAQGKIIGIYETGRDMKTFQQHQKQLLSNIVKVILLISAGIVAIILVTTFYLLSPLRALRRSVTEMAVGKWDTVVTVRTRDEVGDLGGSFNVMARHIRNYISEITELNQAYFRFVPQQFLQFLGKKGILDVHLGDQVEKDMSIMVASVRSFYEMSKRMSPQENFNFVNSFFKRIGPVIGNHQGLINKYPGAGIVALFPRTAESALMAAVAMRRELELYNSHRQNSSYEPIEIGIGIHKGPLMLGIVGEEQRMEGNVLSDDANIAAMLEKLSESLGVSILITENVLRDVSKRSAFRCRSLGRVHMDGKDEPLKLYDVFEGDPEIVRRGKERTKELFESAVVMYQEGRFYDARETFLEVIKQNRYDKAAKLYFYLADEYFQKGTMDGWNGTLSVS